MPPSHVAVMVHRDNRINCRYISQVTSTSNCDVTSQLKSGECIIFSYCDHQHSLPVVPVVLCHHLIWSLAVLVIEPLLSLSETGVPDSHRLGGHWFYHRIDIKGTD